MKAPTIALAEVVRAHARTRPRLTAYIEPERRLDWAGYDAASDVLAARLLALGLSRGDRVGVYLPDTIELQVALLATEKAGLMALGIGSRSGLRELQHLLGVAGAVALLSMAEHRDLDMAAAFRQLQPELPALRAHLVIEEKFLEHARSAPTAVAGDGLGITDTFLLNSTSGTTGMPKCVMHTQARWYVFHNEAVEAGALSSEDVFLGAAPPPFGFGLWTTHVTPTLLGIPTVLMPRFSAEEALALIGEHRVTVLAAVSTQFVMMLNSPGMRDADFSSLRVMFTGGEMVPYERALDFERRTGAAVLQFYGSNETGGFSRTGLSDPQEKRLTTSGRTIGCMNIRLFDDAGNDITASGTGQPGGKGPLLSAGYFNDPEANARLFTRDGYMLMEDIVSIDAEGYLRVAGRKGDFVIRGGKNISCAAVEQAAATHPSIALAAAVGVPDPVLGERVMLFAVLHAGAALDLPALTGFLAQQGVSREIFPEYLEICSELPRSAGDKIAKGELRARARAVMETRESAPDRKHAR